MASDELEFGHIHCIHPSGTHKATIVWLHDIGESGVTEVQNLQNLNELNPNVKWICPTAPERPISALGGQETTAWFDITEVSENMQDDFENLNYVNTYITNILSNEPDNVVKGVAGRGLGATQALYYTSCYALGWVPICPQIVIGIDGWLPGWKYLADSINTANVETKICARSTRILFMHGFSDVVPDEFGYMCALALQLAEFPTWVKQCRGIDAMNVIHGWLINFGF